jgi:hypothetical protein
MLLFGHKVCDECECSDPERECPVCGAELCDACAGTDLNSAGGLICADCGDELE